MLPSWHLAMQDSTVVAGLDLLSHFIFLVDLRYQIYESDKFQTKI